MDLTVKEVRPFNNEELNLSGVVLKMTTEGITDAFGVVRGSVFYALRENTTLVVNSKVTIDDSKYNVVLRPWTTEDGTSMELKYLVPK